ncbi:MAG: DNA-directed RNA polymerase subunit beta' [Clostridia bacterium]|jgi:DNA-directed RNA polymerase subunit beta'|nr:DNA-directed RNA polymerase subunit beta' [Clostridia bacterium]
MFELANFDSMRIGIASPEKIRQWSHGEVTKTETINYRTQKPERDGLFCERIFGPRKDWECSCGKYKRIRYKGVVCDKCGVEVTRSKVRRERMGHIELATPVSHIWFFRSVPSRIGIILDMSPKALEQVLYYVSYVVIDPGKTEFIKCQLLSDHEYRDAVEKYGTNSFKAGMGGESIKTLLTAVDLEKISAKLKEELVTAKGQKKLKAAKRLEVVQSFIKSGNRPEWMILEALPVIPPDLRPMVQLDGGLFATSDLNDLYRRVINRNNRLKKLMEMGAPEVIIRNEKRMLQEAVDALIENGKRGRAIQGPKARDLKSLTAMLRGKNGRFRQNLLGKRVDYSGRSAIVVGPELKMYQCGLPKEMAIELFKPFIMKRLVELNQSHNIKSAKRLIEREKPIVWDVLADVIKDHPVLLNRAPTLHKLGIQAFEPVLVEGRAIKLHPLVCTAFNADFDGDQMPVHIPLSVEACTEARMLMLASNNILKPSDGKSIVTPKQDIVMGSYYLTIYRPGAKGEGKYYISEDEALMAYQLKDCSLQAKINVRRTLLIDGVMKSKTIETSVGRIIFNTCIPQHIGFVDRTKPENNFEYEINFEVKAKYLGVIVDNAFNTLGGTETSIMLDKIKEMGFKYSTLCAVTASVFDMIIPKERDILLAEANKAELELDKMHKRGLISVAERKAEFNKIWKEAAAKIRTAVVNNMDTFNPIKMLAISKARGNEDQIQQLAGIRGLIGTTSGTTVDMPIKTSYREGLSPLQYFLSCRGGRKGLADTALKTADAGYMTRRLVDVSQDVIVKEMDCFESLGEKPKGMIVTSIVNNGTEVEKLEDRIMGRFSVEAIINPKTKEVIVEADTMISPAQAKAIGATGINSVKIRTALTCRSKHGVCAKCYGRNMSSNSLVNIGEAIGVIAAQSIGEPGTQLTMKTFQTGGVVTAADITKGLPRVEELFEARKPKGLAVISEVTGKVSIKEVDKLFEVTVKAIDGNVVYTLPYGSVLKVKNGDSVEPGSQLTEGSVYPNDILRTKGVKGVQEYLLREVLSVYREQGVTINAKHLEVIIRQMLRRVKIESAGNTTMLPGDIVDIFKYETENDRVLKEGGMPAVAKRLILGITAAALSTDSFLSAASFQETSRVLTDAAVRGKTDPLAGLKENVIIGKLIPAGTGLSRYRNVKFAEPNPVSHTENIVVQSSTVI